jgi:DNA-binding beta-propeller fold protein YncE
MTRRAWIPAFLVTVSGLSCGGGTLGVDAFSGDAPDAVTVDATDVSEEAGPADVQVDRADDGAPPLPKACDQTFAYEDGTLEAPRAVATDGTYVFVTDSVDGSVTKLNDSLDPIVRWPGFEGAWGIAVGADGVYVTDTGSGRVVKATMSGDVVTSWGDGEGGSPDLIDPRGLALGGETLYVADLGDATRKPAIRAFLTSGTPLPTVFDGPLVEPVALAVSGERLYVADKAAGVIAVFSTLGDEIARYDFDGALDEPQGIAVDGATMFVTDSATGRLLKASTEGELRSWCGGEGEDGGQLRRPHGITTLDGQLFVADYGNKRLVKIHP